MKRFSFFAIFLLCLGIIGVDLLAFYWLQSITDLTGSEKFADMVNTVFLLFLIGLVSAILILKIRLDAIAERRRQLLIASLYGLTVSSFIPKLLFVITISILYFFDHVFSPAQSRFVVPLVGLFSGIVPFVVIVYAISKSVYHFKIYTLKLVCSKLPPSFNGLRVVQFSDLHLGSFNRNYKILEKAIVQMNKLQPDIIFFTGDLVNNYAWELEGWQAILSQLSAPLGIFAVLGNHDYGDYKNWETQDAKQENFQAIISFFDSIHFTLLRNQSMFISKGTETIGIIGVEYWDHHASKNHADLNKAKNNVSTAPFSILLSHNPSHWKEEVLGQTNIDLTLSGHTHGMQAGVSLRGRSWSPIKYAYEHWAGLYQSNDQYLYVNRGLGWLGFPGRVGMRPEISFFELLFASSSIKK